MIKQIRGASPCFKARMAGVFYLFSVATGAFGETLVRGKLFYAVGLIPVLCFAVVTLLLYSILRPVNRSVAMFAALSNLVCLAFEAMYLHHQFHRQGVNKALVFHAFYCLLIGYLVFRATFLPRMLGPLMMLAGLSWLPTSLPSPLVHSLHSYSLAVGLLGEGSLMLWLLVMGVNVQRWKEQAEVAVQCQ